MSPPDPASESEHGSDSRGKTSGGLPCPPQGQEVLDSLGEALAGVSLGSQTPSSFGASALASVMAPGSSPHDDGWGDYAETGTSGIAFANPRMGSTASIHDGMASKDSHVRNESLQLFLSQDPSQTLGDDVFKLRNPSLHALSYEDELRASGATSSTSDASTAFRFIGQNLVPGSDPSNQQSFGELRPLQDTTARRRTDSPSVTGTTASSRSVSPYANNSDVGSGGRVIQAYQRYDSSGESLGRNPSSFAEDDRSTSGYNSLAHGYGSHPSLTALESAHRSPYAKDRTVAKQVGMYDQGGLDRSSSFPQVDAAAGQTNGQQQFLYVAVPSPDGRGQVLQPVQMLQLPGKPYTYVVPGQAAAQATFPDTTQSSMMVLPPLSANGSDFPNGFLGIDGRGPSDSRRAVTYNVESGGRQFGTDPSLGLEDFAGRANQFSDPSFASPQRPPLDALLGQVRRLSRDQVGCRLVQQALDEEGPMAATLILNEGLPFWGEAMVDPFGNYLFQKVLEKVTPEERVMLIRSVSSRLVNASLNLHGTRSVQKVVELCSQDDQNGHVDGGESAASILTAALAPAAARLCIDSHGNHVIQRILLKLGPKHSKFIFDAVAASVGDVARHRHGCCVIQRCLDSPPNDSRDHLVCRIVEKSLELMQDAYGNYVVQYVLDVCSDSDVHAVCESVVGKVNLLAIQKFSSNVMEKCLERCSDRVKEMYMQEISDPERVRELMMDPFGNYVVQRALSVATHVQAVRLVEAMRPHLIATQTGNGQRNGGVRNTAGGRRIIAKICRRFPNFTLNTVQSPEELYSQNKGGQRQHQQPSQQQQPPPQQQPHHPQMPGVASFPPAIAGQMPAHYGSDPRVSQGLIPVQQHQAFYGLGGSPYYDPFTGGQGGYSGM